MIRYIDPPACSSRSRRLVFDLSFIDLHAMLEFAPGDPTGAGAAHRPAGGEAAQMREALGLDQPSHVRFGKWL